MNNNYPKGAQWRIWDLQVQTILDDGYEQLSSYYLDLKTADPEKWERYVSLVGGEANALEYDSKRYFGDHNKPKAERCKNYVRNTFAFLSVYNPRLAVMAITDHNYYDDVLIDTFLQYSQENTCKVIGGVEINAGGVHMLVFFEKPPFDKTTFSEGIKTFLSKIDVDAPKKEGVLSVCSKSCQDVIKEVLSAGGIYMFPHCNSSNGLFQERGKTDRTHLSDIFNHKTFVLLQGNSKESIDKTKGYIESNPKLFRAIPIYTIASDSRSLRGCGTPREDGHFFWIKGDPTFAGLKQITFEPLTRTRIEKDIPEKKESYLVIDKVRFIPPAGDLTFSPHPIEINDKLNGIIGGKSSGKSMLLYYIAKTIDPEQTERKIKESGLNSGYDFEQLPDFDFEVTWLDGQTYNLRNNSVQKSRQITYVPQMFINYLAENGGQTELRKLIQEILEQKHDFKALYDAQMEEIEKYNSQVTSGIDEYYRLADRLESNTLDLRSKGDKQARLANIVLKNQEIEALRKSSGFSADEEAEYLRLKGIRSIYTKRFTDLRSFRDAYELEYIPHLESTKLSIQSSLTNAHNSIVGKRMGTPLTGNYLSKEIKNDQNQINATFEALIEKAKGKVKRIDILLAANDERITHYRELLAPYEEKIQDQEKLEALNQAIGAEQTVLASIDELEKQRKSLEEQRQIQKDAVFVAYKSMFEGYQTIADAVNGNPAFSNISSEKNIALSSAVEFNTEVFANQTLSLINSQGYLNQKLGAYIDDENNFVFDQDNHLDNVKDFFEKIQKHEVNNIRFNKTGDLRTVTKKLMQNFFDIRYDLSQNTESILKMSPGKKGMILLFLILHLSNAEYPILIDQPEDNLDNRTVYKELKEFVKEKKIQRQIIIVTHNANLVVPTDAENIIVANQSGQDRNKDNDRYRFDYVTGSLENSFRNDKAAGVLNMMGIREHVCEILEGGTEAFREREQKYDLH